VRGQNTYVGKVGHTWRRWRARARGGTRDEHLMNCAMRWWGWGTEQRGKQAKSAGDKIKHGAVKVAQLIKNTNVPRVTREPGYRVPDSPY